ncbi:phage Gp37/Gp68 family protein [soil metagenome]
MSANSKIEWTDHTFNPWTGCTKVSPGCDHCYAEGWSQRAGAKVGKWGLGAPRVRTTATNWRQPLKWNAQAGEFMAQHGRRQRVFCASLADVFDNAVDPAWRVDLWQLIQDTPNLDWLLLTKRVGNVFGMLPDGWAFQSAPWPNVWIGATVVDQSEADRDIQKLLAVPAAKRFLSMEPMLGPVQLGLQCENWSDDITMDPETGARECCKACDFTGIGNAIDWVIVGGESGPDARPMHPDWARSLRDECAAAGVPFLFKQWGEWLPISQQAEEFTQRLYRSNRKARLHEDQGALDDCYGRTCTVEQAVIHEDGSVHAPLEPMAFLQGTGAMLTFKAGKKAAGRLLDGVEWNEVPT